MRFALFQVELFYGFYGDHITELMGVKKICNVK